MTPQTHIDLMKIQLEAAMELNQKVIRDSHNYDDSFSLGERLSAERAQRTFEELTEQLNSLQQSLGVTK